MPPEITTRITSPRWTSDRIETEVAFLKTYSSGFKKVLEDMSPTVTKVVVTDDATLVSNTDVKPIIDAARSHRILLFLT